MPGSAHEVLIAALRDDPSLLAGLVAKLTRRVLPDDLAPVDAVVRFVKTAEMRPDLLVRWARGWMMVEVQGRIDPKKRRRWLLAAGVLFDQTKMMGDVLVITARSAVARWAGRVAHVRGRYGTTLALTPVVLHLGLREAETLLDPERPALAFLAAWAVHERQGSAARQVVERAIEITGRMPARLRDGQWRAIVSVLSERMRAWFEEAGMNPDKIPVTPEARKFVRFLRDLERRGEAKGKAEGKAEGKQDALLAVLAARRLAVTADERARVRACEDVAQLDRWIDQAAIAGSAAEVFRPARRARRG